MFGIKTKNKKDEDDKKALDTYLNGASGSSIQEDGIIIGTMEDDIQGKPNRAYGSYSSPINEKPKEKSIPEKEKGGLPIQQPSATKSVGTSQPITKQGPQISRDDHKFQAPRVVQTSREAQLPPITRADKAPQPSQSPRTPQAPRITQFPQAPRVSQTIQAPHIPQAPHISQVSRVAQIPQAMRTPQVSQIPKHPNQAIEKGYPKAPVNLPISGTPVKKPAQIGTTTFGQPNAAIKTNNAPISEQVKSPETSKGTNWTKISVISIVAITVISSAAGGYYYWMTRKNNNIIEPVVQEEPEQPPITIPEKKFSEENPNILTLDLEKVTAEEIAEMLKNKAEEVKNDGHAKPVEFIVNDLNNNPISFTPVFTSLAGIKLPAFILSTLEERFSIYFYNENSSMRAVLAVELKDKAAAAIEMKNEEAKLVEDMELLYLGNSGNPADPTPENMEFKNGNYNGQSIRYLNIDTGNNVSLDYALTDKYLVIGTSKDSTRAVLDKIASQVTAIEPTTTGATQTTDCPENTDCSAKDASQPDATVPIAPIE